MKIKRMIGHLNSVSVRKKVKQLLAVIRPLLMINSITGYGVAAHAQKAETITAFAKLPMVTEAAAPEQELKVFHMDDSLNEAEGLDTTVDKGAGCLEAQTEHFSVYTAALLRGGTEVTCPSNGDGSAENPYQITSAAELFWFARLVNGMLCLIYRKTQRHVPS